MGSLIFDPHPSAPLTPIGIPADGRLLLGRGRDAQLRLSGGTISRSHAVFYRDGDRDWVGDAGSRNGIRVNGTRLLEARVLEAGDRIEIGEFVLRYESRAATIPTSETTPDPANASPPKKSRPPAIPQAGSSELLQGSARWSDVRLVGRGGMGEVYHASV